MDAYGVFKSDALQTSTDMMQSVLMQLSSVVVRQSAAILKVLQYLLMARESCKTYVLASKHTFVIRSRKSACRDLMS